MVKYIFKNPKFVTTAIKPKDYPVMKLDSGEHFPEIAVAGRSNVGKSSLLNNLFQSRGLVHTSSKPGKTQALNFFTLNDELSFVDLPGYGYAKVPLSVRKKWGPMIQSYFEERKQLSMILFLFDIRRMPNEDDFRLMEWLMYWKVPTVLVLTKVDKLKQRERKPKRQEILEAFGVNHLPVVHYSTTKKIGRQELIHAITDTLEGEEHGET